MDNYNSGYAALTDWKNKTLTQARRRGYVETMYGRRRRVPDLGSDDFAARARSERQAINAIIQGTASEICKQAMIDVSTALPYPKCKMAVQVHDELVVIVPIDEAPHWRGVIETAMGNGKVLMGVELEVEAHNAQSWVEAKG